MNRKQRTTFDPAMLAPFTGKRRRLHTRRAAFLVAAAACIAAVATPALCARPAFPDKPIRLVIGSAPGSGPDIISRVLADRLYKTWGQRIVVDSRPGAAGVISADLAVRAPADGYTWMMLTSQLLVATSVIAGVKFNLERDFASISLIGTVPFVLVANAQLPARNLQELIELAKKSPGNLRYGSAGNGTSEHLSGVLFNRMTGTNIGHVPYKGVAQAVADTIAREVHMAYGVLPAVQPMVQAGRIRALGVTSIKRSALLPDVPSIAEVAPGYETLGWYSIVAPIGTPAAVLQQISIEVAKAVKEPELAEQLRGLGIDIVGSTGTELDAFRREQTRRIAELVKAAGSELK